MKDFGEWFSNPARRVPPPAPAPAPQEQANPLQDLADTLQEQAEEIGLDVRFRLRAKCRACEREYDFEGEIADFDADKSYCGGSPRCIP